MKPSEIFGIVVRVVGFLGIVWGLWNILDGADSILLRLLPQQPSVGEIMRFSPITYFVTGVPAMLFGAFCFFRADKVVRMTYGDR
jgi:hypothetical protein